MFDYQSECHCSKTGTKEESAEHDVGIIEVPEEEKGDTDDVAVLIELHEKAQN